MMQEAMRRPLESDHHEREAVRWVHEHFNDERTAWPSLRTIGQLLAMAHRPDFVVRSTERSHREGIEDGFDFAIELVNKLASKGFSRPHEIANILTEFSNRFTTWAVRWDGRQLHNDRDRPNPPLKFDHESWTDIRRRILRRDKACTRCNDVIGLEVDHIVEVQDGGLPTDDNLRVLCKACHTSKKVWRKYAPVRS